MNSLRSIAIHNILGKILLNDVPYNDSGDLNFITQMPEMPNLEELDYYSTVIEVNEVNLKHLELFPELKSAIMQTDSNSIDLLRHWLDKRPGLKVWLPHVEDIPLKKLLHPQIELHHITPPDNFSFNDLEALFPQLKKPMGKLPNSINLSDCSLENIDWKRFPLVETLEIYIAEDQLTESEVEKISKKYGLYLNYYEHQRPLSQIIPAIDHSLKDIYKTDVKFTGFIVPKDKQESYDPKMDLTYLEVDAPGQIIDLAPLFQHFPALEVLIVNCASIKPLNIRNKLKTLEIELDDCKHPVHELLSQQSLDTVEELKVVAPGATVALDRFPQVRQLEVEGISLTATAVKKISLEDLDFTDSGLPQISNHQVLQQFLKVNQIDYDGYPDESHSIDDIAVFAFNNDNLNLQKTRLTDLQFLKLMKQLPDGKLKSLTLPPNITPDTVIKILPKMDPNNARLDFGENHYRRSDLKRFIEVLPELEIAD